MAPIIGPLRAHSGVLRRARPFRTLLFGAVTSGLGTWIAVVALSLDVFDRTGSANWVTALLIADFVPAILVGMLLSPLVDRSSRRTLMLGADLARLGVFASLPFVDSATGIVALAAVAGLATGFFQPSSLASIPNLVAPDDLPGANALLRGAEYLTTTLGTAIGGGLVALAGPHPAYAVNAVSFGASFLLVWRLPPRLMRAAEARERSRGHLRDLADGYRLVFGTRALLTVFVAWNLAMVGNAAINVAEVVLAKQTFGSGDVGFGLMWAFSGLGLASGSLYGPTWLERRGLRAVYPVALGLMAFGELAAAVSPSVWVAVWCMALLGLGNGAAIVYNVLLVQRGAPDHLRGRAFSTIMGANFTVLAAGMIAAGPLTDAFGARWVFGGAAAFSLAAALAGGLLVRGASIEAPAPGDQSASAAEAVA